MSHTFSAAYDRVLRATGCAGQEELAKKLGLRQSFITDCRRRGEFTPEVLLALVERCNLNPHWVRTGEGKKYLLAFEGAPHLSAKEIKENQAKELAEFRAQYDSMKIFYKACALCILIAMICFLQTVFTFIIGSKDSPWALSLAFNYSCIMLLFFFMPFYIIRAAYFTFLDHWMNSFGQFVFLFRAIKNRVINKNK